MLLDPCWRVLWAAETVSREDATHRDPKRGKEGLGVSGVWERPADAHRASPLLDEVKRQGQRSPRR